MSNTTVERSNSCSNVGKSIAIAFCCTKLHVCCIYLQSLLQMLHMVECFRNLVTDIVAFVSYTQLYICCIKSHYFTQIQIFASCYTQYLTCCTKLHLVARLLDALMYLLHLATYHYIKLHVCFPVLRICCTK